MSEAGLGTRELIRVHESDAVDVLVRGNDRPTAVICYSDLESTLLVNGLWQLNVRIPADVSLIGFNDIFSTRYMTPPLTTVGFDAAKIGEVGAQLLLKDTHSAPENKQPTVFRVKPTLIVRGSTGPVRAADHSPHSA
jgi:LacI family transcriptional regulator